MTQRATSKVFIDNERVRVTEWRFAPGAATGWHRHEMDYVVVPMADGDVLTVTGPCRVAKQFAALALARLGAQP